MLCRFCYNIVRNFMERTPCKFQMFISKWQTITISFNNITKLVDVTWLLAKCERKKVWVLSTMLPLCWWDCPAIIKPFSFSISVWKWLICMEIVIPSVIAYFLVWPIATRNSIILITLFSILKKHFVCSPPNIDLGAIRRKEILGDFWNC